MSEKLEKIRDFCEHCYGSGDVSACCNAEVDDGRCQACGRFCKIDVCHNCDGRGYNEYHVGDEVEVFVCVWTDEYLKDLLYHPKKVGDTRTYRGKIVEFIDKWNVRVRVPKKRKVIEVKLEDIETI